MPASELPTWAAANARSPSLFGIGLPGYCLPLLFHKLPTVHRVLEASDTVVRESASHGRVGPTNATNLNAASHAAFWSWQRDAKRLNPCSPILATWLSISCACAAPASASAAMAVRRRRFAVIWQPRSPPANARRQTITSKDNGPVTSGRRVHRFSERRVRLGPVLLDPLERRVVSECRGGRVIQTDVVFDREWTSEMRAMALRRLTPATF
jgi:hypothetical protein